MSMQKRMILATVFSLLFFVVYALLFPPQPLPQAQTAQEQQAKQTAAPQVKTANDTKKSVTAKTSGNTEATLVTLDAEGFTMKIDSLGRISSKVMKGHKYTDENENPVEVVNQYLMPKPLEVRFNDSELNKEAFTTAYSADVSTASVSADRPVQVTMTQKLSSVTLTKKITFYADGHYDVNIELSDEKRFFLAPGFRPAVDVDGFTIHGALVETSNDIVNILEDGEVSKLESYKGVRIASAFDRYYATMFYAPKGNLSIVVSPSTDGQENPILFVEGDKLMNFHGYIGPKEYATLNAIQPFLTDALEYGFFTWISAPMFWLLQWLFNLVGNWGWAIVLVTIITRIVLYPLSYKGMVSMHKLKQIAPLMKDIQKKHKGDPQKLNAAMMALYKKHGANPLGGCLPLLLQIPIFFAIYRVLLNSIELQDAEWILWINDLSNMDPYFILPIIMGATMYYQQKITPTNFTDPMQEKIFKFLPLIFTLFFFTFPAGLVLYWAVNNILTIIQQMIVNKKFDSMDAAKAKAERES